MKLSKWLIAPVMALALMSVGCGASGDTKVIEAAPVSEDEQKSADDAYDDQYGQEAEAYE